MRCICLLHNITIDTEGTTHDPSVQHETSQIPVSPVRPKQMSAVGHSVGPQKGATDVRNVLKAHI